MELNKKGIPKMRWFRILPVLLFSNIVQNIDKGIMSYALPGGMAKDLAMNASISGLLGTVFSIGYLFLQIPGGSLAAKGKCKKFLAVTMLLWGIILFLLGGTTSSTQALVYRFLLGFSEGAIYPALITIIANWFPNEERGRATAIFISSGAISGIFMGPLAALLMSGSNWRVLFHFAAILSFGFMLVWIILIAERPVDAKWLSEEERNYLLAKFNVEQVNKKSLEKPSKLDVIKDPNLWKLCFMFFCLSLGTLGLSFWLPTIIKNITNTGMTQTGYLATIPNICMLVGVITMGFISDKTQKRRLLAGVTPVIFTGLLVISMLLKGSPWLSFAVLSISCLFLQGAIPNLWAILALVLSPEKAGASRGIVNICGNIGGLIAPLMIGYIQDVTGSMMLSWYIIFGFCCLGFLVSLMLPKSLNSPKQIKQQASKSA